MLLSSKQAPAPAVTRRLVSLLISPAICDHSLCDKSAPLYTRLLASPLFRLPRNGGGFNGGGGDDGGADGTGAVSSEPAVMPMVGYVEHLPLLSRESVGGAPPSLACFTQLATLLTLLQRRFKLEPSTPLKLRELVAPLRAAARAVNLSHAQEELIEGVLGALSALVPPELAGAMPAADAASSSRLDEAEFPSLSKHGQSSSEFPSLSKHSQSSSPEVHQGTLPRGTPPPPPPPPPLPEATEDLSAVADDVADDWEACTESESVSPIAPPIASTRTPSTAPKSSRDDEDVGGNDVLRAPSTAPKSSKDDEDVGGNDQSTLVLPPRPLDGAAAAHGMAAGAAGGKGAVLGATATDEAASCAGAAAASLKVHKVQSARCVGSVTGSAKASSMAGAGTAGSRKATALASEPDVETPVDWRSLPVFPTHTDLSGEPLQLPRRVSEGSDGL